MCSSDLVDGFVQADVGGHEATVFGHQGEGLAAEGFGLVAHADQAAALVHAQLDEAGQMPLQRGDGLVDGRVVVGRQ